MSVFNVEGCKSARCRGDDEIIIGQDDFQFLEVALIVSHSPDLDLIVDLDLFLWL